VGKDRVERIWRREGLKVPQKQKPRGRLWLNDGSCVRLRPERRNHVWSYDFVSARTHDGRSVRLLNLIDEHTRESLLVRAERRWSSARVISALADVMVMKGVPEHLRSDNGPEFVAKDLRKWLAKTGAKTLYIEPGSPWENGYCESFNSKLRDEFLNGEIFYSMKELRVLAERWRVHYNTIRPHSSLGYRSPAPEAWLTNNMGHGEVETATRFPLLHTPDGVDSPSMRGSGRTYTMGAGFGGDFSASTLTIPGLGASYTETAGPTINPNYTLNLNLLPGFQGVMCQNSFVGTGTTASVNITFNGPATGIQTLTLPNNQTYTFSYDPVYGLVNKIIYPTGAWVEYAWEIVPSMEGVIFGVPQTTYSSAASCGYQYDWVAVKSRIVSYDGVTKGQEQDFSYQTNWTSDSIAWNSKTTTVVTTDLLTTGNPSYKTVYTYLPGTNYDDTSITITNTQENSPIPVENTIAYYDTSDKLLKTVTKTWYAQDQMSAECVTVPNVGTSGTFYQYAPFDPSSWGGGIFAEASMTDLVTDKAEYDYGLSSCIRPAATPTRETVTSYQSFAVATNSLNPIDPSILDRPLTVKTYDRGTLIAETDYGYDGAGIQGYAVSQVSPTAYSHDSAFAYNATSAPPRGNLTSVTKKCFQADCQNEVTTLAYDEAGQVTSVTDGRGYTTSLSHADSYTSDDGAPSFGSSYSTDTYVTQITRPATGSITHISNFQWDYDKGELRLVSDENKQKTTYLYSDPWARLTQSDFPDGGQTTVTYNDTAAMATPYHPTVTTTTVLNSGTNEVHESEADPMGRVIHAYLTDPLGNVTTDTVYDGFSRVYTVSTPYRSKSDSTYGLTTYSYDALGRKTIEKDSDGRSTKQWCYDNIQTSSQTNCHAHIASGTGEWVDAADENGNDWQRTSDALGRMTSVVEPNGYNQAPTMTTAYAYNALDDLLGVTQCGGPCPSSGPSVARWYSYDSLSQLATSSNPETGVVQYSYDADGNLSSKTDARKVVTSFTYDALNRVLSKTYSSDTASSTPFSCYQYDTSSIASTSTTPNWIGRLTNQWTQSASAGSCSSSLPASGLWTRRSFAYDSMGRITNEQQCTPSNCSSTTSYTPGYTYDLAGNLLTTTDGVTQTSTAGTTLSLANCYDAAGRLQALTSNWSDTTHPQSLFSAQSSASNPCPNATSSSQTTTYAAFGGLMNAVFGNSLTLSRAYDNRLRITSETDMGSVSNPATNASATVTITGAEQIK
jgi:putative transposase